MRDKDGRPTNSIHPENSDIGERQGEYLHESIIFIALYLFHIFDPRLDNGLSSRVSRLNAFHCCSAVDCADRAKIFENDQAFYLGKKNEKNSLILFKFVLGCLIVQMFTFGKCYNNSCDKIRGRFVFDSITEY